MASDGASIMSMCPVTVFAYGATGAGKTFTMLGSDSEPGVMFHTMRDLYQRIGELKTDKTCEVAVSYLEVCVWQFGFTAKITLQIFCVLCHYQTVTQSIPSSKTDKNYLYFVLYCKILYLVLPKIVKTFAGIFPT